MPGSSAAVSAALSPAQLATLAALIERHGRRRAAQTLGTTTTTLDCLQIGKAKPSTVGRVAEKLDEIARRSS